MPEGMTFRAEEWGKGKYSIFPQTHSQDLHIAQRPPLKAGPRRGRIHAGAGFAHCAAYAFSPSGMMQVMRVRQLQEFQPDQGQPSEATGPGEM